MSTEDQKAPFEEDIFEEFEEVKPKDAKGELRQWEEDWDDAGWDDEDLDDGFQRRLKEELAKKGNK